MLFTALEDVLHSSVDVSFFVGSTHFAWRTIYDNIGYGK